MILLKIRRLSRVRSGNIYHYLCKGTKHFRWILLRKVDTKFKFMKVGKAWALMKVGVKFHVFKALNVLFTSPWFLRAPLHATDTLSKRVKGELRSGLLIMDEMVSLHTSVGTAVGTLVNSVSPKGHSKSGEV